MLAACKGLEKTLIEISKSIVEDDLGNMAELLSKRKLLLDKIQAEQPTLENAQDIEESLKAVISLEQLITGLAQEKKEKIMEEMTRLRNHRKAHCAYGNQCLKGVGYD